MSWKWVLQRLVPVASILSGIAFYAPAQASRQDGSGAYATGVYRNLFTENGHSQEEVREKIDAAYQQLFHGDPHT
jgi:oligosaccharide reducing-end xylanase